jgi:hypothetical protein
LFADSGHDSLTGATFSEQLKQEGRFDACDINGQAEQ